MISGGSKGAGSHNPLWQCIKSCLRRGLVDYRRVNKLRIENSYAVSRRDFMLASTALLATGYAGRTMGYSSNSKPRIAVVGAGLAGLTAAYFLSKGGLSTTIYEASARVGGRVLTDIDSISPGQVVELGGEFIDSTHKDMLALASEFNLPLIDIEAGSEDTLKTSFFFDGQHFSEAQITAGFRDFAPRLAADAAQLSSRISYQRHTSVDIAFDHLSLTEYFDRIGISGWLRKLLDVAYVTEYGLETDEQSCINFLSLISTDLTDGFKIFGASDQRFKVRDGNQLIMEKMAKSLKDQLRLEHRLVKLRPRDAEYHLVFDHGGKANEIKADIVILALPFTMLRQVDLGDFLPPMKRNAIEHLGYGMNAKLILGTHARFWRGQGWDGDLYSDLSFQTGWDSSRLRDGATGAFTFYLGGRSGLTLDRGAEEVIAKSGVAQIERVFPGFSEQFTGLSKRVHWPSEPFAMGSYTCFRPGQWTTISGSEGRRVNNLYFVGEHCSADFQGFMNGAAETGRKAAQAIIKRLL